MGIVTLADAKAHLRYPSGSTADDAALNGFIDAATNVIDMECDVTTPTQFDETYDGGATTIFLWHKPILAITNIEEGWGFVNFELTYIQTNTPNPGNLFAYSIEDEDTGEISRRSGGNILIPFVPGKGNIRVVYTAGRASPIPGAIRLAALELIAHWWQNSQQRSMGNSNYDNVATDFTRTSGYAGFNHGVPYRILEMLRPYRRLPVIG